MKKLKLLSEGVLYKNPNPGFKVECAFLPNIVPLSDTGLICFYRLGSAFYSVDGKLAKLRSTDGGETWFQEGHVWDAAGDDTPYNYSAPHGTLLRDGSMVLVAFRVDSVDPEVPMYNPETGGWRPVETVLFRSEDSGHTWSEPELVDFPYQGTAAPPSQVIELNDGRWLLTGEHWKAWDDVSPCTLRPSRHSPMIVERLGPDPSNNPALSTSRRCSPTAATCRCWMGAWPRCSGLRTSERPRTSTCI